MRKAQYTVTDRDVQEHTTLLLQKHVGLKETKGKCNLGVLVHLISAAAARLTSVFAACSQMKNAPSGEAARKALLAALPDYAKLQRGVNRALTADVPKALRKRKHHFAIDLSPFGLANDNDVFYAADRPYGLIEGTLTRDDATDPGLAW